MLYKMPRMLRSVQGRVIKEKELRFFLHRKQLQQLGPAGTVYLHGIMSVGTFQHFTTALHVTESSSS